jgi:hypothetical protein
MFWNEKHFEKQSLLHPKHPKYITLKGVGFFTMQSFIVYPITHG